MTYEHFVGGIVYDPNKKVWTVVEILTVNGHMTGVLVHRATTHEEALEKRAKMLETLPEWPGVSDGRPPGGERQVSKIEGSFA